MARSDSAFSHCRSRNCWRSSVGHAGALILIALGRAPPAQRLGQAADSLGSGPYSDPLRRLLGGVLPRHPHGSFTHLGGICTGSPHGSILSTDGPSDRPGTIQLTTHLNEWDARHECFGDDPISFRINMSIGSLRQEMDTGQALRFRRMRARRDMAGEALQDANVPEPQTGVQWAVVCPRCRSRA